MRPASLKHADRARLPSHETDRLPRLREDFIVQYNPNHADWYEAFDHLFAIFRPRIRFSRLNPFPDHPRRRLRSAHPRKELRDNFFESPVAP